MTYIMSDGAFNSTHTLFNHYAYNNKNESFNDTQLSHKDDSTWF